MNYTDHDRLCQYYWDLREQVRTDPEYASLTRALEELEPRYEAILAALSEEDRLTLDRYITLRENRNLRMLEYALSISP